MRRFDHSNSELEEYIGIGGVNRLGDRLYVTSDDNRTIVYSLSTAQPLRQIFGRVIAANPTSQRICTTNRRDEIIVYNLQGDELDHTTLGSPIRFASFRQNGAKVLLLAADQKLRTLNITDLAIAKTDGSHTPVP